MVDKIPVEEFLRKARMVPVVDVRSPSEFRRGHLPGARNIPLFDDEERAAVGTEYKRARRDSAILKGLEYAGPKMASLVTEARGIAGKGPLLIHCWRGGLRSESMAWLFHTSGISCQVLLGGYKAFRQYIRERMASKIHLITLGGLTGSGKTSILQELARHNHQVIDLESLAHHRGSAFGSLGQEDQPTTEQFENNLYEAWSRLDLLRPVWIEDESKCIGSVFIPDEIYQQMHSGPVIAIEMDLHLRVQRLSREYACFSPSLLSTGISRIRKRLGEENSRIALEAVARNDYTSAIEVMLRYYDKTYRFSMRKRDPGKVYTLRLVSDDPERNAKVVIRQAKISGLLNMERESNRN